MVPAPLSGRAASRTRRRGFGGVSSRLTSVRLAGAGGVGYRQIRIRLAWSGGIVSWLISVRFIRSRTRLRTATVGVWPGVGILAAAASVATRRGVGAGTAASCVALTTVRDRCVSAVA